MWAIVKFIIAAGFVVFVCSSVFQLDPLLSIVIALVVGGLAALPDSGNDHPPHNMGGMGDGGGHGGHPGL